MSIRLRLRTLFKRLDVELELDEEIRYHLERQVEANIAHGMSAEEAAVVAFLRLRLGEMAEEAA